MRLFTLLKDILLRMNLIADYVVETGISGKWRYRKWASGACELWSIAKFTIVFTTSYSSIMGGYGGNFNASNDPFPFTVADGRVTASANIGNGIGFANTLSNGSMVHGFICGNNPTSAGGYLESVHVTGRWK